MAQSTLISLCWIALGLSALGMIGAAAIGSGYHPEKTGRYVFFAVAPVIAIGAQLFFLPRVRGIVWGVLLFTVALSGVGLVGFFANRLFADAGDALLWLPPFILGLGQLGLVFVARPAGSAGGDA